MKRQLIRSRLLKITVAFAMMISAIWLSGCGRQETETVQGAVYVAEDGDDETGTGAWKAPYATISHAAQTAPGSLIIVREGDYKSFELGPECSGSKDSPTVIRPAEGAKVVIHVEGETCIFLKNVHDISVEGLETVGGTYAVEYVSTPEAGKQPLSNISIRNCRVHGVRGQRSRKNRICANLVLGGEEGIFFEPVCREEGQVNEISGNAAAEIENEESWTEEYGAEYSDRSETVDGFRPLIKDTGSAFVPDEEQMKIYKAQKSRNRWNQLLEKVESWFHRFLGESEEE